MVPFFKKLENKHREVQRVIEQAPTHAVSTPHEPGFAFLESGRFPVATLGSFPEQVGSTHSEDKSDST